MATNIAIRLQAEGSAEIKRVFDEAGNAGKTAFDGVTSAMDRTGAEAEQVVRKVREATEAARVAQTTANTATGPASPPAARPAAPASSPATAAQISRIRAQLDDEYRNQSQADRAGRLIAQGEGSGQFTPAYAERLRTLADRKYGPQNDNQKEGLNTYDRLFVKYQATDFAQQVMAGTSPITAAAQQGGQLYQQLADREGGLGAGLKQLGVTAAGLVTPFALAGAAAVAATATFALAASSYSRDQATLTNSLKLNGRTTDATVAQLDTLARSNADAGKVSTSTAREIAAGYASTGEIGTSVLETLIQKTGDYAKLTGQDVPAATAELARMFSDPAKGAEDLGNKLGGVDDKTRQYIQTLAEMGDKIGAQTALSEAFRAQVAANTDQTTRWGQAWNFVSSTADKAWESIKRAAGGAVSTPQQVLGDLSYRVEQAEKNAPGSEFTRQLRAQRDAAKAEADKLAADEAKRVADAQSAKDSVAAAGVARGLDPQFARLSEIDRQLSTLRDAVSNPDTRARMDPTSLAAADQAYIGLTRARETMVDVNGKLISSEERVRQQDKLTLDAAKAKTTDEKAAVAERQKAFDLAGKTVSRQSASDQIANAGAVARISADSKGGKGKAEADDDFDRAVKQTENSIRRQAEQAQTYGQTADVVARYRTETELLTAAKRAEREITPELTAQIQSYADQAAEAAKRNEDLKEQMKRTDDFRGVGSDGVRTLVRGLADGTAQGKLLENVLSSIKNRVADLASNSLNDFLFGQRGTSGTGSLGGLIGQLFGGNNAAANAPAAGAQGPTYAGGAASLTSTIASFFGFDGGGYTGPGGRFDPAGIVHRGEVVFSQDDVKRFGGADRLEAIRRGGRGYANGGYVGGDYVRPGSTGTASGSGGVTPAFNFIDQRAPGTGEIAPTTQRRADGGFDVIIRSIEGKMGQRASKQQGPFKQAYAGAAYGQG